MLKGEHLEVDAADFYRPDALPIAKH